MNIHKFICSIVTVVVSVVSMFAVSSCVSRTGHPIKTSGKAKPERPDNPVEAIRTIRTIWNTDFTDEAVACAREYALDNLSGLTEEQRAFINFTQPVIYENMVFPRYVNPLNINGHIEADNVRYFPVSENHDLMHTCFVWTPPGLGARVVVAGQGERSMFFWKPYRVLLKTFYPGNTSKETAFKTASSYVRNNMLYLSKSDLNRARFENPEIVYTKFELLPDLDSQRPASARELAEYRSNPKKTPQISLVWASETPGQVIVITGFSDSGTLTGWKLKTGELMSEEKLANASLTDAEIAAIEKIEDELPALVFRKEEEVKRNPYDTETNPNALTGGSFVFK